MELSTAGGHLWSGRVISVGIKLVDGSIDFTSPSVTYLHLGSHSVIRWRSAQASFAFAVTLAAASLEDGRLTIMAEEIIPVPETGDPCS